MHHLVACYHTLFLPDCCVTIRANQFFLLLVYNPGFLRVLCIQSSLIIQRIIYISILYIQNTLKEETKQPNILLPIFKKNLNAVILIIPLYYNILFYIIVFNIVVRNNIGFAIFTIFELRDIFLKYK